MYYQLALTDGIVLYTDDIVCVSNYQLYTNGNP